MPGDYDIEYSSPWAGANYMPLVSFHAISRSCSNHYHTSVSVGGTEAAKWDKDTWGPLADLARNHPEAGVHFQGTLFGNPELGQIRKR